MIIYNKHLYQKLKHREQIIIVLTTWSKFSVKNAIKNRNLVVK